MAKKISSGGSNIIVAPQQRQYDVSGNRWRQAGSGVNSKRKRNGIGKAALAATALGAGMARSSSGAKRQLINRVW